MLVLQLFVEFFKTGLFAVGGGLATLPFLYQMAADTGWFTAQDIADLIAISESTPGPLGVNMATYVGFKSLGIFGGIVSTLGLIAPSIIVIILVSKVLDRFKESSIVQKIFYGLRPASTALITAAGLGVARIALLRTDLYEETKAIRDLINWRNVIVAAVLYAIMKILAKLKLAPHPVVYIGLAAVAGIIFRL